jgi:hypothetical protein
MEASGQLHAPAALPPGKEPSVPIRYEAGWAPEPVLMQWWRQKFPAPAGTRTPDHPVRNPAPYRWAIPVPHSVDGMNQIHPITFTKFHRNPLSGLGHGTFCSKDKTFQLWVSLLCWIPRMHNMATGATLSYCFSLLTSCSKALLNTLTVTELVKKLLVPEVPLIFITAFHWFLSWGKGKAVPVLNWAPHHEGVLVSGGIASYILNPSTIWRWVVSFNPGGNSPPHYWIGSWVSLTAGLNAVAKRKNPITAPIRNRHPVFEPVA